MKFEFISRVRRNSTNNVVYYFILQKTLCSKRTLVCKYCGQGKLAMEMSDHETYCGSRTERCDRCPDWVNFEILISLKICNILNFDFTKFFNNFRYN